MPLTGRCLVSVGPYMAGSAAAVPVLMGLELCVSAIGAAVFINGGAGVYARCTVARRAAERPEERLSRAAASWAMRCMVWWRAETVLSVGFLEWSVSRMRFVFFVAV